MTLNNKITRWAAGAIVTSTAAALFGWALRDAAQPSVVSYALGAAALWLVATLAAWHLAPPAGYSVTRKARAAQLRSLRQAIRAERDADPDRADWLAPADKAA